MRCPYSVSPINAFNDNYIWAITKPNSNQCVVVDPGDGDKVHAYLLANKLTLSAILVTHHHHDHVGGINMLTDIYNDIPVYGPMREAQDVVTHPLADGESILIAPLNINMQVIEVPGHTLGHIAFHDQYSLFCGDTLFSGGCGRMFEGTPVMFEQSLSKLAQLPTSTKIYCAHEYTMSNLAFASAVLPNSIAIENYVLKCEALLKANKATIPSTIEIERDINPFLNVTNIDVKNAISLKFGLSITDDAATNFKWLRQWKDSF